MTGEESSRAETADRDVPIWARDKPRRRPALSRDIIVESALAIADAEGIGAVSIRRVAADLGVRPMSLYTYIDRKEDLVVLMRDQVNREVVLGSALPAGWREAVTAIARRTRDVILRHPWIVDTNASGAGLSPNALRHIEESLTALRDLGLGPRDAVDVLTAVDKFTLGHATFEIADRVGAAARQSAAPYFESLLATGEFPALARLQSGDAAGAITEPRYERQFERGLKWLLDGIAADIEAP
jgi:AcrR family transcriptional regulator